MSPKELIKCDSRTFWKWWGISVQIQETQRKPKWLSKKRQNKGKAKRG